MNAITPIAAESATVLSGTVRKPAADRTGATQTLPFAAAAWPVWRKAVFTRQR